MVPATADFDYKRYLASREWALLKEELRFVHGDYCQHCCAAPYQETHHLTYARIGHEDITDLLPVCSPCHRWLSAKSATNPVEEAYWFTAALTDESGERIHLVYPRLKPEAYEMSRTHTGTFFERCREDFFTKECLWCKYKSVSLRDFYYLKTFGHVL